MNTKLNFHSICTSVICLSLLSFALVETNTVLNPLSFSFRFSLGVVLSVLFGGTLLLSSAVACFKRWIPKGKLAQLVFIIPALCISITGIMSLYPSIDSNVSEDIYDTVVSSLGYQAISLLWGAFSFFAIVLMFSNIQIDSRDNSKKNKFGFGIIVVGVLAAIAMVVVPSSSQRGWNLFINFCPNNQFPISPILPLIDQVPQIHIFLSSLLAMVIFPFFLTSVQNSFLKKENVLL